MIIDHHLDRVYVNDSFPLEVGKVYRLMGNGDDYVQVTNLTGRYVTIVGVGDLQLEDTILRTSFDNIVKEEML